MKKEKGKTIETIERIETFDNFDNFDNFESFEILGDEKLLSARKTAFFCSRNAPPDIILRTLDLAKEWREKGQTIISGFHTPVEKEVLRILLKGGQPIIICPARSIKNMRIPQEWKRGVETGRILIISPFGKNEKRITAGLCDIRNEFVAKLADEIIIAHASKDGKIEQLANRHKQKLI